MLGLSLTVIVTAALVCAGLLGLVLAASGLAVLQWHMAGNLSPIANALWNIFNSFTLTAVPMFILLGELLGVTGLARRIYAGLAPLFERLPGGLMQSNIGVCTAFSAISGSSTATSAVVGSIAYREMAQRGYSRAPVAASIAAGGTLGILIPPSVAMIVYASMTDTSVGNLFLAGIVPGLALAGLFMVYIAVAARLRPIAPRSEVMPLAQALRNSAQAWPFLLLIFAILGTMFLGLATPTEAAALGVFAVIILAVVYREFTVRRLWAALKSTTLVFSALALIIAGAVILSQAVALTGMPRTLLAQVQSSGLSPLAALLLVYLLYLVMGSLFGPLEMMLITLPFTFPLITGLGYDPVWFGIVLVILIEVGLLTPPVGINLFVLLAITEGDLTLGEIAAAAVPYWFIMLAFLVVLTAVPAIALTLPRLLM